MPPANPTRTVAHLLRWRAAHQPEEPCYSFLVDGEEEGETLTYAGLDRRSRAVAALLQGHARPGDRALLLYPPGLEFLAALFGCMYAGVLPVPAYPPDPTRLARTAPRLAAIARDAAASVVLTIEAIAAARELILEHGEALRSPAWLATDRLEAGLEVGWRPRTLRPATRALLQYTSGSTAEPRGIVVTHEQLLTNVAYVSRVSGFAADGRLLIWLPQFHDLGLVGGILSVPYAGHRMWLMSPIAFLQQPLRWLRALSRWRATHTAAPNFAFDLCVRRTGPADLAALDLSSVRRVGSGAEPVRRDTVQRFLATFAPCGLAPTVFDPGYGLAEATLLVAGGNFDQPARFVDFDAAGLAAGRAVAAADPRATDPALAPYVVPPEHEVVIADPERHTRLDPGAVGEIWVRSPSVASGYFRRAGETRQIFRARLAPAGEGPFLRTGDLGFLHGGELFIAGRLKDLIVIRGRNLHPQDVERTAEQSHPLLRPGGAAAFGVEVDGEERLVVVQEVRAEADDRHAEIAAAIRSAVAAAHDVAIHTIAFLERGSLPKTSSGKVQRYAARSAFLEGSAAELGRSVAGAEPYPLGEIASGADAGAATVAAAASAAGELGSAAPSGDARAAGALEAWLIAELALELDLSPGAIRLDVPLVQLGVDSLTAVRLVDRIEERTGSAVDPTALLGGDATIAELAARLREPARAPAAPPRAVPPRAVPPAPAAGDVALSHGQQALWFLQRLAPASTAYHVGRAVRVEGPLDSGALHRALQRLADRHAALRSAFPLVDGRPVQRVQMRAAMGFREVDASSWSEAEVLRWAEQEMRAPFDLEAGPLLRVGVLVRGHEDHVVVATAHHLVVDYASLLVLARELGTLYAADRAGIAAELPPPAGQYPDFVRSQTDLLAGNAGPRLLAYWREALAGGPEALDLPTDRPRPMLQTYRGETLTLRIERELATRLRRVARERSATLPSLTLAAFQVLLHRQSGQQDLIVGCPAAGRVRREWRETVGYFINTLPVRASVTAEIPFAELLARTRDALLGLIAHQEYPFALLVRELRTARDPARSPIFQVVFDFLSPPPSELRPLARLAAPCAPAAETTPAAPVGDLRLSALRACTGGAQVDLFLTLADDGDSILGSLDYNADVLDAGAAGRLLAQLRCLLAGIVADPDRPVGELPLLHPRERARLLGRWIGAQRPLPWPAGVHEIVAAQIARAPERAAVRFGSAHLDYGELGERSRRLAHRLLALGVERGTPVGLCVRRSLDLPVAMLAILQAGGAYVPLDPDLPPARLAYQLQDARVDLVVSERHLAQRVLPPGTRLVCLDDPDAEAAIPSPARPAPPVDPEQLAYVMYTSGSTGRPKGVAVSHGAVANFLAAMRERPGIAPDDVMLAVSTAAFDFSVLEIFAPLSVGAQVVIASREVAVDGRALRRELDACEASVMNATPATWRMLLEAGWRPRADLRMLCGGEAWGRDLADRLLAGGGALWNIYGPTEATVICSVERIAPGDAPLSIGRPMENMRFYVLDERHEPVPLGVAGELWVGGACLAQGYLHQPELTASRFVGDPFDGRPGARMYRTGDLVRARADGALVFVGRCDGQIKLRGFRIEPGEIEVALRRHPAVREAAVTLGQSPRGEARLVAYVATGDGSTTDLEDALRHMLEAELPGCMVPSAIVSLEALPLTASGKLDRKSLPAPTWERQAEREPRTPLEETLARAWADVLGVGSVGVADDFFALGGDSLGTVELLGTIAARLGVDLPASFLLQHPTVESAAVALEGRVALGSEACDAPTTRQAESDVQEAGAPSAVALQGFETRPLLSLLAARRIPPVDAAAIATLPAALLRRHEPEVIAEDWCGGLPLWAGTLDTAMGRIGLILLPRFDTDLYDDRDGLLGDLEAALDLARHIGAGTVSLTGLLSSATSHGRDLAGPTQDADRPRLTTGHATTAAAVVLSVHKALALAGRSLAAERVACLGLGSIGTAALRLLLSEAQPAELLLCDVLAQQAALDDLAGEIQGALGFSGRLQVLASRRQLPEEIYDATLIVAATNVGGLLDASRLAPGTIVVDDSAPPALDPTAAIERLARSGDVLATAGGVLRAPYPIARLAFLPRDLAARTAAQDDLLPWLDPRDVGSCVLSSILSHRRPEAPATLGPAALAACRAHLEVLRTLGFAAADLHLGSHAITARQIAAFRGPRSEPPDLTHDQPRA